MILRQGQSLHCLLVILDACRTKSLFMVAFLYSYIVSVWNLVVMTELAWTNEDPSYAKHVQPC